MGAEHYYPPQLLILLKQLQRHDAATEAHCWHTLKLAQLGMDILGVRPLLLYYAALMHDIGKLEIPVKILKGKTKFNVRERQDILDHPANGAAILKQVGFSDLALIVRAHHERWDGHGYPERLTGTDIPIESRIITIADSFAAMIEPRTYRPSLTYIAALDELKAGSGTQFEPVILDVIIQRLECRMEKKERFLDVQNKK